MLISQFQLEFSYISFLVYDSDVRLPGNENTDLHFNQGFSRRKSTVTFRTLLEFGFAAVKVFNDDYVPEKSDERVIMVPFYCPTGKVHVEGPEEVEPHTFEIEPGHYQLTAAQQANYEDESLFVRLYFFKVDNPTVKSRIIVKDEQLDPQSNLSEDAEVAM